MILIAEDNKTLRELLTKQLDQLGYESITVNSGGEAIDKCMKHPISLILMDVNMPQIDGIEATKRIRELEKRNGLNPLPIIAMTSATETKQDCLKAGMNDFYQKPLLPDLLIEIIKKWHRKPKT